MHPADLKVASSVDFKAQALMQARRELAGQREVVERHERLALVQAEFGLCVTERYITDRVRLTLPWRPSGLWGTRTALWTELSEYSTGLIPDEAIAKYHVAKQSGHFTRFFIVEPKYHHQPRPQIDPWLVGRVGHGDDFIVLAYWD